MTIMQLRCFVEVAKELNFAKAAKNLYITQPAVSRHIQSLEDELGTVLLTRNRQGVELTASGNQFFTDAADILERLDLAKDNLANSPGNEVLRIGCVSSFQIRNLAEIFKEYHKKNPGVIIHCTEVSPFDYYRLFITGHLDAAFVPGAGACRGLHIPADIGYQKLYQGTLICAVSVEHPFAFRSSICPEDLTGETLIFLDHRHCPPEIDQLQLSIRRQGKGLNYYYSGSSLYTVPMIEAGLGIAIMPDFICPYSEHIVKIPLSTASAPEYGLLYRKDDRSERIRDFLETAVSLA